MANAPRVEGERAEERLHFLDYWRVVKKRKEIIIATLVIIVFTTAVFSWIAKPIYSADSQIKIEQRQRPMDVFRTEAANYLPFDQYEFETHRKQLESRPVLERVVKGEIYSDESKWYCPTHPQDKFSEKEARARLDACPQCGSDLERLRVRKHPNWELLTRKWAKRDAYPGGEYRLQAVVSMLRANLRIRPEKGTRLITIRFESQDKEEAQLVADMVAEAYIQLRQDIHETGVQSALNDLERKQSGSRRSLKSDQIELTKKQGKFTLDAQGQLIQYQDLSQVTQQKRLVEAEVYKLQRQVDRLSAMTTEERIAATQEVSQLAGVLAGQEAGLKALLEEFGLEHPTVKAQKGQIASLKEDLQDQTNGALEWKKITLDSLKSELQTLETAVESLNKLIRESQQAYTDYVASKNDVDLRRAILLEAERGKLQEALINAIPREDIQISETAQFPSSPIRPRKIFNVMVSIFIGITLGTGLAYFVDYLDTSIKNVDDLELYLNMSTLAIIPQQRDGLLISDSPKSHAAENYRMLWTNIQFGRRQDKFKNVMVTSGGMGEGKTTTVVNLGIAAAQMESKVLLVDSDLRRPKIHKLLKFPNRVGLSDVLLKDVDPREVVIESQVPGLWVMPSGKMPSNVIGLLSSQKMKNVITTLGQHFDVVFYDSPPVMGVSDASVMAGLVDRVLLVVDFRKFPRRLAMRAKKSLENVGGQLLGTVINNLNIQKEDYYYYGYGKAYRYYYRRYEQEPEEKEAEVAQPKEGAEVASNPEAKGETQQS